ILRVSVDPSIVEIRLLLAEASVRQVPSLERVEIPNPNQSATERLRELQLITVAVIGAGKIGEAVAKSIAKSVDVERVLTTRRNPSTRSFQSDKISVLHDNKKAARESDLIIISVKAGDAKHVLNEIAEFVSDKVVISLMAAVSVKKIEAAIPNAKVVRAMPNIGATIGEAMTAYTPSHSLSKKDIEQVQLVLGSFGDYIEVPENLMDAVTALSGSGPAYIAILIEAMVSAGLKVGIPRDIAFKLVTKTLTGTADLLSQNKMHPAELRDTVTTPAGTTIAGIYELEKGSLRTSIMNAVEAATQAAERVAKKFESE
ncbi:MAG: pyrroline-5-carboxylate reductase, partial [Nitrososphaerota archaeon]|nr:pyrroline-5-carboxylate reductase [Nitrososphaerota archaeon]